MKVSWDNRGVKRDDNSNEQSDIMFQLTIWYFISIFVACVCILQFHCKLPLQRGHSAALHNCCEEADVTY